MKTQPVTCLTLTSSLSEPTPVRHCNTQFCVLQEASAMHAAFISLGCIGDSGAVGASIGRVAFIEKGAVAQPPQNPAG